MCYFSLLIYLKEFPLAIGWRERACGFEGFICCFVCLEVRNPQIHGKWWFMSKRGKPHGDKRGPLNLFGRLLGIFHQLITTEERDDFAANHGLTMASPLKFGEQHIYKSHGRKNHVQQYDIWSDIYIYTYIMAIYLRMALGIVPHWLLYIRPPVMVVICRGFRQVIGVPLVIIHFGLGCSFINKAAIGVALFLETPISWYI